MNQNKKIGKVILAGAGPGDPELITLKALRYLQNADVIITDRLVSDTILEEFTRKEALILHAGKQCKKGGSTPQATINELLVEYALQGNLVVRLKGGDVSFFSNILDELQALREHHIAFEIVPGVTAASGAAAYAGIPLTARGYSAGVRFLTYYKEEKWEDNYWKELSQTNDTLVFYMSCGTLELLVGQLLKHGIGTDKYLAVVEQATTPMQNVYSCNIHDYFRQNGGNQYVSPSLIIIGKCAVLYEKFQWIPDSKSKKNYFKPVNKNMDLAERA
jgi:uroporphyrin-III C-methyltransferase